MLLKVITAIRKGVVSFPNEENNFCLCRLQKVSSLDKAKTNQTATNHCLVFLDVDKI